MVYRVPTFDEITDDAQSDARVQMGLPVSRGRCSHCRNDRAQSLVGEATNAPAKLCRGF
jgi:hypothetical protein